MLGAARLILKSYSITGSPPTCFRSFDRSRSQPISLREPLLGFAGIEVPKHDDIEKTFADLKARLGKTATFVQSFKPGEIDGSEDREIDLKLGEHTMSFKGQPYLVH